MTQNLNESPQSSDNPAVQERDDGSSSQNSSLPGYLWQGKVIPAFWTTASVLSLAVNLILILVLVILGRELFNLKGLITNQLIGGLYDNFVLMDDASIVTTIAVNDTIQVVDTIPVVFDLPLAQDTSVVLTSDTPVKGTTIYLNGAAVPLDLILPEGTALNIRLDMVVPVSQTVPVVLNVPVALNVPVNIPLNKTELHQPFVGLQKVVSPYQALLTSLPDSWEETPLCGSLTAWFCRWLFDLK